MDFKDYFTQRNIIIGLVILVLVIALYYYFSRRRFERLTNPDGSTGGLGSSNLYPTASSGDVPFKTNEITNLDRPDPSSSLPDRNPTNPGDLLPNTTGANWGNLYPVQNDGGVYIPSVVDPSFSIGINSISSTLRGSSLDLRSEPIIPKREVSPWNNSSYQENIPKIGLDPTPSTLA